MSNTPTESEFDKELMRILRAFAESIQLLTLYPEVDGDAEDPVMAIKQAVDKHVIGEDEIEDIDLSKSAKSRWGVRARNRVRSEERVNLYGGDKK